MTGKEIQELKEKLAAAEKRNTTFLSEIERLKAVIDETNKTLESQGLMTLQQGKQLKETRHQMLKFIDELYPALDELIEKGNASPHIKFHLSYYKARL